MLPVIRGASPPLSPLLLAASRAQSWVDVLRAYTDCRTHLGQLYTPTTAELHHGLSRMEDVWALSLFYYDFIKKPPPAAAPDGNLVVAVLRRFKSANYYKGLTRIVEEDVDSATLAGAKSKVTLAAYTGMWATALATLMQHPKLRQNFALRRTVVASLSLHHQWQQALRLLSVQPPIALRPTVVRPIVRCFGRLQYSDMALRLTAASLAAGYTFDTALLSALMTALQDRNQWWVALETAQDLQLFSATRLEVRQNTVLFNQLVSCLYEADAYSDVTLHEVVQDVLERSNPRNPGDMMKDLHAKHFRLRQHSEIFHQFQGVLLPLSNLFSKMIRISRWYSRSVHFIAEAAVTANSAVVVMDTNFLMQLVQKNLTPEHFFGYMKQQYPDIQRHTSSTIVIPFTVLQETHKIIWQSRLRYPLPTRLLLWSRVEAIVDRPNVYALSLAAEFPCSSLSIITKMAYSSMSENVAGHFQHDPDLRILNVCVSLQHYLRMAVITENVGGVRPLEGSALFALLKYHVRRHCNTVKGSCVDRLLLCTMDRRMAHAARRLGVRVFPNISDAS